MGKKLGKKYTFWKCGTKPAGIIPMFQWAYFSQKHKREHSRETFEWSLIEPSEIVKHFSGIQADKTFTKAMYTQSIGLLISAD